MIYFTADQHFWNQKQYPVGSRRFETVRERNEFLVRQWNAVVSPDDEVYLLGDISDGDGVRTTEILRQLNGSKYLVIGNHDRYLEDPGFQLTEYKWCRQYYELLTMDTKFVLFHFPLEIWSGCRNERIHLHGHCHSRIAMQKPIRRYEVGVDAHEGKPVSIEEIWKCVQGCSNREQFWWE